MVIKRLFYQIFKRVIVCFAVLNLVACSTSQKKPQYQTNIPHRPTAQGPHTPGAQSPHTPNIRSNYICQNPSSYRGKVIGNGTCVSLIKRCSLAPNTPHWSVGPNVLSLPPGTIPPGSIIATFRNGKYPNVTGYHAAIYINHDSNGIWVWDQWVGKPVHKRLIRLRKDKATASNSAQAYHLVK